MRGCIDMLQRFKAKMVLFLETLVLEEGNKGDDMQRLRVQ